jgi:murein endopeptidase
MYGSSFTLKHLTESIAKWRNDVAYDGELILSDISKKGGGRLEPHKSHTAGRDIDIWLPTIKGVYKTKYLKGGRETERRPLFAEVDWYALWGLIRALIESGAVQNVFLDWVYQPFVYRAAANMGATEEQLRDWIQWPQKYDTRAIFSHSADHLSHIHVRFKCAPYESECSGKRYKPRN